MKHLNICFLISLLCSIKAIGQISSINEGKAFNYFNKTNTIIEAIRADQNSELQGKLKPLHDQIKLKTENSKQNLNELKNIIEDLENELKLTLSKKDEKLKKKKLLKAKQDLNKENYKLSIYTDILEDNSEISKSANNIYLIEIKAFNKEIEKLEETIKNEENIFRFTNIKTSINRIKKTKQEFKDYYPLFLVNEKKPNSWLPTKDKFFRKSFFQAYYNQELENTSYLNSLSYINSSSNSLISSELASDNLGWFRVSFGSAISFNDDEEDKDDVKKIEKLINAGGNFYLDVLLPICATYNSEYLNYYSYINTRAAVDIEGFDSDIKNATFNSSLGVKNYFSIASDKKEFLFSLLIDSNIYYGSNDFFKVIDVKKQILFNTNATLYLTISQKYRVALRTNFASHPSLRTERIGFGIQLLK